MTISATVFNDSDTYTSSSASHPSNRDENHALSISSRRPTGDVGISIPSRHHGSATPSHRLTGDEDYGSATPSRHSTGDKDYGSATPSRHSTGDGGISIPSHHPINTSADSNSSRFFPVFAHSYDPKESPNKTSINTNCDSMITEPHIKQASAPLSPVLEQAGEALPMVSEICSNEPMEQSSAYNKECTSLNAETATSNMTVTHKGRTFTNDFSLEIPKGAIPEGETLDVDFGVTLSGPFKFPVDLRPVSPVFWVCVQKKSQFSKPVTVTLPQFLDLKNDDDKKIFRSHISQSTPQEEF